MKPISRGKKAKSLGQALIGISFHCVHLSSTPSYWDRSDSYWCLHPQNRKRSLHRLLLAQQMMYSLNSSRSTRGGKASVDGRTSRRLWNWCGFFRQDKLWFGSWFGSVQPSVGLSQFLPWNGKGRIQWSLWSIQALRTVYSPFLPFSMLWWCLFIPTHEWQYSSN